MIFCKNILLLLFINLLCFQLQAQTLTVEQISGQDDAMVSGSPTSVVKRLRMAFHPETGYKVFVWAEADNSGTGNKDIRCAVYSTNMTLLKQFTVNTTVAGDQLYPSVVVDKSDNKFYCRMGKLY